MTLTTCLLTISGVVVSAAEAGEKVAILPVRLDRAARAKISSAVLDEALLSAAHNLADLDVIGRADFEAMLDFERQKALLGCSDTSCFSEIAGAVGARTLIVVHVTHDGRDWTVLTKVIDMRAGEVLSRKTHWVKRPDNGTLIRALPQILGDVLAKAGKVETRPGARTRRRSPLPKRWNAELGLELRVLGRIPDEYEQDESPGPEPVIVDRRLGPGVGAHFTLVRFVIPYLALGWMVEGGVAQMGGVVDDKDYSREGWLGTGFVFWTRIPIVSSVDAILATTYGYVGYFGNRETAPHNFMVFPQLGVRWHFAGFATLGVLLGYEIGVASTGLVHFPSLSLGIGLP